MTKYINFIRGEVCIRDEINVEFGIVIGSYDTCKFAFHIYFFKYSFSFYAFYSNKIFEHLIYWHNLTTKGGDTNENV